MEKTLDDIAHEWAYVESQHSEDKYSVGRICFDRGVAEMKKRAELVISELEGSLGFLSMMLQMTKNNGMISSKIKSIQTTLETYRKSELEVQLKLSQANHWQNVSRYYIGSDAHHLYDDAIKRSETILIQAEELIERIKREFSHD